MRGREREREERKRCGNTGVISCVVLREARYKKLTAYDREVCVAVVELHV